jgi:hypothetical protein
MGSAKCANQAMAVSHLKTREIGGVVMSNNKDEDLQPMEEEEEEEELEMVRFFFFFFSFSILASHWLEIAFGGASPMVYD